MIKKFNKYIENDISYKEKSKNQSPCKFTTFEKDKLIDFFSLEYDGDPDDYSVMIRHGDHVIDIKYNKLGLTDNTLLGFSLQKLEGGLYLTSKYQKQNIDVTSETPKNNISHSFMELLNYLKSSIKQKSKRFSAALKGKKYKRMSDLEYNTMSGSRRLNFTDTEVDKICEMTGTKKNNFLQMKSSKVSFMVKNTKYGVVKIEDNYYIVIGELNYVFNRTYWICDTFEGVIECLKDIKDGSVNIKEPQI